MPKLSQDVKRSVVAMAGVVLSINEVRAFFFRAMLQGWVAGAKGVGIGDMPGFEAIDFTDGDFRLRDCFGVYRSSGKSAGFTTVTYKYEPVLFMSYGGWYDKRAIPVLKSALRYAYEAQEFVGGRGPFEYIKDSITYRNSFNPLLNQMNWFEGDEGITDNLTNESLGHHHYWGMSLM